MLIVLSTSLIVVVHDSSLRSLMMKQNVCASYSSTYDPKQSYFQVVTSSSPNNRSQSKLLVENMGPSSANQTNIEQKPTTISKSNYLQTLSVEDAQQEKRNRILRQKSSTETSGLGSSLDYTSADELNNQSSSNSRRHSSNSNNAQETKVGKPSPIPIGKRKVSWRTLPHQGFSKSDNFTLETIESSGSSHANNDHSTPQSLSEYDPNLRIINQYQQSTMKSSGYCQDFFIQMQEASIWKLREENAQQTFYDSELDFGTLVHNTVCEKQDRIMADVDKQSELKRQSFHLKSNSSDSDKTGWSSWSREKRSESSKRMGSDLCQLIQKTATKNIDFSEFQSLLPKSNYVEMDQSLNNGSNVTYTNNNNNPSTSQSSNPQSCNDTMQMSANYLAELSKKSTEKRRKDEDNRLTHEQIHYLVEYWDHDTFVRLRTWALCFALLAVGLQIFVAISSSWSFFGDEKYPNYSGLWITCIPENHTCILRLPFFPPDNGYRDSILCLLALSTIFSIGGSGMSFSGLCVTALARKLYYYHSAGEIFFVSGMIMALAVSLYSITMEIHFKFHKHRYGYTFWLAWFAAFLLLLSALNLLMDELIQGSTKFHTCSCLAKCFRCCYVNRSQISETGSSTYVRPPEQIALQRTNSRKPPAKVPDSQLGSNRSYESKSHNQVSNQTTHWRTENNDIEEDYV